MDNDVTDTPEPIPAIARQAERAANGVQTPDVREADLRRQASLLEWRLRGESLSEDQIAQQLPTMTMLERVMANHPGLTAEIAQQALDAAGY